MERNTVEKRGVPATLASTLMASTAKAKPCVFPHSFLLFPIPIFCTPLHHPGHPTFSLIFPSISSSLLHPHCFPRWYISMYMSPFKPLTLLSLSPDLKLDYYLWDLNIFDWRKKEERLRKILHFNWHTFAIMRERDEIVSAFFRSFEFFLSVFIVLEIFKSIKISCMFCM